MYRSRMANVVRIHAVVVYVNVVSAYVVHANAIVVNKNVVDGDGPDTDVDCTVVSRLSTHFEPKSAVST